MLLEIVALRLELDGSLKQVNPFVVSRRRIARSRIQRSTEVTVHAGVGIMVGRALIPESRRWRHTREARGAGSVKKRRVSKVCTHHDHDHDHELQKGRRCIISPPSQSNQSVVCTTYAPMNDPPSRNVWCLGFIWLWPHQANPLRIPGIRPPLATGCSSPRNGAPKTPMSSANRRALSHHEGGRRMDPDRVGA